MLPHKTLIGRHTTGVPPYDFFYLLFNRREMLTGLLVQDLIVQGTNLERQAEQVDEACGICLIVAVILVEGCHILGVQAVRRGYGSRDDVALVELELNVAGNGLLGGINECGERLAQRRVPLAVVNQLAELESNLILVVRG